MAVARPRPAVAGQKNVLVEDRKTAARIRQAGLETSGTGQGLVPKNAATGADAAQRKRIQQGARKEAALDVLAGKRSEDK